MKPELAYQAQRHAQSMIVAAQDLNETASAGLCALVQEAAGHLVTVDPVATADFLHGLAHMIRTGEESAELLTAARLLDLTLVAMFRASEGQV